MKEYQIVILPPRNKVEWLLDKIMRWVLFPTLCVLGAIFVLSIWFGIISAVIALFSSSANAHSWYSERRDPIYNQTSCCGGTDCAPLPAHAISITPGGDLRITLTVEEARKINPVRRYGFDRVIAFERIQDSEDGTPHICLMAHDLEGDPREGYYCVFLPMGN